MCDFSIDGISPGSWLFVDVVDDQIPTVTNVTEYWMYWAW